MAGTRRGARGDFFAGLVIALTAAVLGLTPAAQAQASRAQTMGEAATAFLETLTDAQRDTIVRPFGDDAARVNWSNLPVPMAPRDGLALGSLDDAQRSAFHEVLLAAMSSQGYHKAASIMWIDDILRVEEEAALLTLAPAARARREPITRSRDSGQYWIVVFGQPGDANWGWMLSGHHLAANFTVAGGKIAFTPLFLGASPQTVTSGKYAGWRVLEHEIDRAFALAATLDEKQRARTLLGAEVSADLFTGRGRKDSLAAPVGMPASMLRADQQAILWGLIREYTGDAADEVADSQLEAVRKDGLDKLHVAWWGPTDDPARRFMYRIHGPSILIEYAREPDMASGGPANHVHAIVRDPRNDYGEDWLERHYVEAHQ
ncbi:MAG: DUF3500 domain-containing protein [Alphaproteobacteria bacterium]|nr:DUF3500 domain-containing protein [Alphaproteobacteria bacterium]